MNKKKLIEFYNDMTTIDQPILKYLEDDVPMIKWCAKTLYKEIGKVRSIINEIITMMEDDNDE